MAKRVLVTGADGFVGRALCRQVEEERFLLRAAVWQPPPIESAGWQAHRTSYPSDTVVVGDIGSVTDWSEALQGVDVVIHLAARVHVMKENAADPLAEFRRVNVEGTERLARSSAEAKVKRFVYVSSIGVNGNSTQEFPFTEKDDPHPHDPYSLSKWEAEQVLKLISRETGLELVIVRPPLAYGPRVPGNFLRLLRLVSSGIPLPLGSIDNKRSFIGVRNLASFLVRCAQHPKAVGETFLVADGEDLSTPDLIRRIAKALGVPDRLFPFPPGILHWAARVLGRWEEFQRLCGSLQVDASKARSLLDWKPPFPVNEGLAEMADWYRDAARRGKQGLHPMGGDP
jgi:nucleoside-diphosphate-sugar epimerase